jgi:hypothetical protein
MEPPFNEREELCKNILYIEDCYWVQVNHNGKDVQLLVCSVMTITPTKETKLLNVPFRDVTKYNIEALGSWIISMKTMTTLPHFNQSTEETNVTKLYQQIRVLEEEKETLSNFAKATSNSTKDVLNQIEIYYNTINDGNRYFGTKIQNIRALLESTESNFLYSQTHAIGDG